MRHTASIIITTAVGGTLWFGAAAVRGRVGYVTQDQAVYRDLTARQNLRYFASLAGSRARDLDEVLDVVGLTALADRPVSTYSGGEAGRVSLACALVADPDLLVMDEPTAALDAASQGLLAGLMAEHRAAGGLVVAATHQALGLKDARVLALAAPEPGAAPSPADADPEEWA